MKFFALFFVPTLALAQNVSSTSLIQKYETVVEVKTNNTYNENNKIDGSELKTNLWFTSYFKENLGAVIGAQASRAEKQNTDTRQRLEQVSFGAEYGLNALGADWTTILLYNHFPDAKKRYENSQKAAVELYLEADYLLGTWGELNTNFDHSEYVLSKNEAILEEVTPTENAVARESYLQVNPAYLVKDFALGFESELGNVVYENNQQETTVKTGPFVAYKGKSWESAFKMIFNPYLAKNGSYNQTDGWEKVPVYKLELAMVF